MHDDLPPDDSDDVLEKVDALLKKHQSGAFAAVQPRAAAAPVEEQDDIAEFDDIPTLTDIVEASAAENPAAEALLSDLEERLYRELEARFAPQLAQAFHHALAQLLEEAKLQISLAVREHLRLELQRQSPATWEKPGGETRV